jgi:hypothetical protein
LERARGIAINDENQTSLWEMVRDNEIQEAAIKGDDAQATCEQLVKLANQNGGAIVCPLS